MITIEMISVVNTDRDQEDIPHEWEDVKYQGPTTPPPSSTV